MADITFNCQYCEQKIEAPEEMAGSKANCPSCQCEILIPIKGEPFPVVVPLVPSITTPPSSNDPTLENAIASQTSQSSRFVAAKCPSCGGDLQVPDNRDQVKCMYCGGTVITRQAIQLASGVNVSNILELAKAAALANNFKEAYDYYTKTLEQDPKNVTAWLGKAEAAGWMSTLANIRIDEMISGFNNAISYSPESSKPALRIQCAQVINKVTTAFYSIAKKHVHEFVGVNQTWNKYLKQCAGLVSALEVGHAYDPNNKTTIENIICIYIDNINGIRIPCDVPLSIDQFTGVNKQYEAELRAKIDKYTLIIQRLDPGFTKPQTREIPFYSRDVCFVATATFGNVNHPTVMELRHFRDAWLIKRKVGRLFVKYYYKVGPYVARVIRASKFFKRVSYFLVIRPALMVTRTLLKNSN